jgi:hypothetical protein
MKSSSKYRIAQSGRRGGLTPAPHTTGHTDPKHGGSGRSHARCVAFGEWHEAT